MPANRVPRRRLLTLAALTALTACGDRSPELETSDLASASGSLGVYEFQALVDSPGTVVLDVRTPEEFAEGHLDGAINIDVESDTFKQRIDELDREVAYAVYCRSGNRSQTAVDLMVSAGFAQVAQLDGGIQAWIDAGLPTVR